MQQVLVYHVGSAGAAVIVADDFTVDDVGHLYVKRGGQLVAQFAATKWSAVVKDWDPDEDPDA